jgi:hypothetical protein
MDDVADPGTVNVVVTGEADMAVEAVCGVCADIGFVEDRTGGRTEPFWGIAMAVVVVVVVCVPAGLPEPGFVTIDGGLMVVVLGVRDIGLAMRDCEEALLVEVFEWLSAPNRLVEDCRGEAFRFRDEDELVRMVEKEEGEGRAICECKSELELSFLSMLMRGRLLDRKADISLWWGPPPNRWVGICEVVLADMLGREGLRSFASRSAALRRKLLVDEELCEVVRDLPMAFVVVAVAVEERAAAEGEGEGEEEVEEEEEEGEVQASVLEERARLGTLLEAIIYI